MLQEATRCCFRVCELWNGGKKELVILRGALSLPVGTHYRAAQHRAWGFVTVHNIKYSMWVGITLMLIKLN